MPLFCKKMSVVSAVQFNPSGALPEGVEEFRIYPPDDPRPDVVYRVKTIKGMVPVSPGDWVIAERDGIHHYPCIDEVFHRLYRPYEEKPVASEVQRYMSQVDAAKEKSLPKVRLEPFADIVVLEPIEPENETAGKILLPDTAKKERLCGRVVAVGPGKLREDGGREPMDVRLGDIVYYQRYSGDEYEEGGLKYRMMHQTALFGRYT